MKVSDVLKEFDSVLESEGVGKEDELTEDQQSDLVSQFDTAFDAVKDREEGDEDEDEGEKTE